MSLNFSAGPFEKSFAPKKLGNWEVPHWYPKRPRPPEVRGLTIPLADSQGRLLPRARRAAPAWGFRRTAWNYPNRITRQLANELSKDPLPGRYTEWLPKEEKSKQIKPNVKSLNELVADKQDEKDENEAQPAIEYEAGCVTDPATKLDELEELDLKKLENLDVEHLKLPEMPHHLDNKPSKQVLDPFSGYYYARKMHMDNLLHRPLPDALGSKLTNLRPVPGRDLDVKPYSSTWVNQAEERPLTCIGTQKHFGDKSAKSHRPATTEGDKFKTTQGKSVSQMDLAICWDYKTANPRDEPKRSKHIDGSNGSLAPAVFSMVHSPKIDLHAIPDTGRSNAIFSQNIVHDDLDKERVVPSFDKDMSKNKRKEACETPLCPQHSQYEKNAEKSRKNSKEENGKSDVCDGVHGCGSSRSSSKSSAIKTKLKHQLMVKNAWNEENNNNHHSGGLKENHSPNVTVKHSQRRKSTDNGNCNALNVKNKLCQSSPNVSKDNENGSNHNDEDNSVYKSKNILINRSCMACNEKKTVESDNTIKPEYKMAFKAGKPNSMGSSDKDSSSNATKNSVKVPKMRDPYGKKSYSIPTLAPPFNRCHDTNGYPEHWRLASVYQHAYKPPGPKRRPLLPSVYQ